MTESGQGNAANLFLAEYLSEGRLGTGGMGIVDLWHSQITGQRFAVKKAKLQDPQSQHRFLSELVTWFDLPDHPHLAACRFFRTVDEEVLIFAEFVEAGSLADLIRNRKIGGLREMLDIAIQSAWGLQAAHAAGLVHHDIKPSNMLLTESGIVKLTDFGLAKAIALATDNSATAPHSFLKSAGGMTIAYRSPEQARRLPVNYATDIWSWALSVLEMFHGSVCWLDGAKAAAVLTTYSRYGAPDCVLPRMSQRVMDLLAACFHEDPGQRPNAADLATALWSAYAEIVGQNYPRKAPPGALEVPTPQFDRKTFSLAEWHDAKDHFLDVLTSAGKPPAEIEESYQFAIDHGELSVRQAVRNYRAGVAADLVAYEELVHYLKPLFSNPSEALQSRRVALYVDKALVHKVLGDVGGALALYDAAAELLEPNIGERRVSDQLKSDLAIVYSNKGETLEKLNKLVESEDLLRRAIDLLERVIDRSPDLRDVLAGAHLNLAEVLRRRNLAEDTLTHYDRAIALREERDGPRDKRHSDKLANAYLTKTNALKALGKIEDAREAASRAVSVCQQALDDEQLTSDRLFEALFAEADCCRILGRYQIAITLITRAIDGYKKLTFDHGRRQLQARLANAHMLRGTILFQSKQNISLAEGEMKAGIGIYEQLVLKEGAREVAHDLFTSYSRLGGLYQSYRRVEAAVEQYDKAIEMWSRLPASETQGNRLHDLATTYLNKAMVIERGSQPNWNEVNSVYGQAIKVWEELVEHGHPQFRGDLARAMLLRAPIWPQLGDPTRVRVDVDHWLPILREEAQKTGRAEFTGVVDWAQNNLRY